MADGRLDSMWDSTSAVLAQLANMRTWVFGQHKKVFAPADWNPRRRGQARKREMLPGGMEALKELVLGGKFKARR